MEKIINDIYTNENCMGENSFSKKRKIKDKILIEYVNKAKERLQKWFPGEIQYNYNVSEYDSFKFYVLYNNKFYTYDVYFGDAEKFYISLESKYIIYDLTYYKEIVYFNTYGYEFSTYKSRNSLKLPDLFSSLRVNNNNEPYRCCFYYDRIFKNLQIINNRINDISYFYYAKNLTTVYDYKYNDDNNCIYHCKSPYCKNDNLITSYKNFLLFKLFI